MPITSACKYFIMPARTNQVVLGFAAVFVCVFFEFSFADSIVNSRHNLSSAGPGKVKAVAETQICIFCHTPHNASAQAPLWNRYESGKSYMPYTSTTLKALVGQPAGASKLCLSCHDGTVALGMVRSRREVIPTSQPLTGQENLGTDLSDDHPISFRYDAALAFADPQLKDPAALTGAVGLDKDSQLQCTSCHDPHNNQFGSFLRMNTIRGNLCLACHNMNGWGNSLHKNSPASWNGVSVNPWAHTPWGSVVDNGCENCHSPHHAGGGRRLLNYPNEEDNCLPCHNGNVAQKNILPEFNKLSVHPAYSSSGMHDAAEEAGVQSRRHAACSDCHNAHAVSDAGAGWLAGALKAIKGVNGSGLAVEEISYEYELCFRCHGDANYAAHSYVDRQFAEDSTRREFDPANRSFHPLENIGKNPDCPSLIAPLTTSSLIKCTDCHNNDAGPGAGGSGTKGPHGSIYRPLLERNLSLADNQSESFSTYALCYKCHDRNSILANRSFSKHRKHIVDNKSPCTACHDPHGVKSAAHLINFDRNIVSENSAGQISFEDSGRYHGSCSLKCHNYEHNNTSY